MSISTFKEFYTKRRTCTSYKEDKDGDFYKTSDKYLPLKECSYPNVVAHYKIVEKRDNYIVGTSLAFTASLFQCIIRPKLLYTWFRGLITDGYALIFLSPFIYLYWILITILYIPLVVLFGSLVIGGWYFTLLEIPASFINKESLVDTCVFNHDNNFAFAIFSLIIPILFLIVVYI